MALGAEVCIVPALGIGTKGRGARRGGRGRGAGLRLFAANCKPWPCRFHLPRIAARALIPVEQLSDLVKATKKYFSKSFEAGV